MIWLEMDVLESRFMTGQASHNNRRILCQQAGGDVN